MSGDSAFNNASSLLKDTANRVSNFGSNTQQSMSRSLFSRFCGCNGYCSLETYSSLFDIDTSDVTSRIDTVLKAYRPVNKLTFLAHLRAKGFKGADLYGPLWISTTFVLLTAMSSNLRSYLNKRSLTSDGEDILINPMVLSEAATVIYTIAFLSPLLSYFFLNFWVSDEAETSSSEGIQNLKSISLFEMITLYGYSYVPFLPAVLLASIPDNRLSFLVLIIATLWSSIFLVLTLKKFANFSHLEVFSPDKAVDQELDLEGIDDDLMDFESLAGDDPEIEFQIDVVEKRQVSFILLFPFTAFHFILGVILKLKFFAH